MVFLIHTELRCTVNHTSDIIYSLQSTVFLVTGFGCIRSVQYTIKIHLNIAVRCRTTQDSQTNTSASGIISVGRHGMWKKVNLRSRCPTRIMASEFLRFLDHTQRLITVGGTLLGEWSARRRDLYLTKYNTHSRQPSMGYEATVSEDERPRTYDLDRADTGIASSEEMVGGI